MKRTIQKFTLRCYNSINDEFYEEQVDGEIVFEMFGFKFFVHGEGPFNISEVETGFSLETPGGSKQWAIRRGKAKLIVLGEDTVIAGINKAKEIKRKNFSHA